MLSFDLNNFFHQFLYNPKEPLLFNNGFFVYFFTVFIALFYIFRKRKAIKRYIFCFFSLYFFYKASGYFVAFVIISAITDFILSNLIYKQNPGTKKLVLLYISIVFNLGLLITFKYTNFFISIINSFGTQHIHPLNLILPVGISFYTFENLSYTIDVYRGQFKPATKFSDYLLFLSFFPKLVMGPIVRAHDFVPQINQDYEISESKFAMGFYLIISGLFKKLIISDFLTLNFVDYVFEDPARYSGFENLMAVYGYAIVIYCDFSGYSDVAIGIARWLGFNIPGNFLSPYQSKNISEFWRRWHISLSSWLKDYLYIPLGGNRGGSFATYFFAILFFVGLYFGLINLLKLSVVYAAAIMLLIGIIIILPAIINRKKGRIATSFNLLTTMLLGGLWHGASWNFIIWGALHGIALSIHKLWETFTVFLKIKKNNSILIKILSAFITFQFVCFTWIFFKANNFNTAILMINQILFDFGSVVVIPFLKNYQSVVGILILAFVLHSIPDEFAEGIIGKYKRIPVVVYIIIFFVFLCLYGMFKSSEQVMPIYLRF